MTKRPSQPIHFKDQDQKDRFAQAAIAAGFETGRGPGITAWLKMLGERECSEPETVAFESMTPGERWWFLAELGSIHEDDLIRNQAYDMAATSPEKLSQKIDACLKWDGRDEGYQARYNAALAYVKGVMDD